MQTTYFCNVYADGLVTVWLSRQTAAFDRKLAASVGRKIPIMVVAKMKPGINTSDRKPPQLLNREGARVLH